MYNKLKLKDYFKLYRIATKKDLIQFDNNPEKQITIENFNKNLDIYIDNLQNIVKIFKEYSGLVSETFRDYDPDIYINRLALVPTGMITEPNTSFKYNVKSIALNYIDFLNDNNRSDFIKLNKALDFSNNFEKHLEDSNFAAGFKLARVLHYLSNVFPDDRYQASIKLFGMFFHYFLLASSKAIAEKEQDFYKKLSEADPKKINSILKNYDEFKSHFNIQEASTSIFRTRALAPKEADTLANQEGGSDFNSTFDGTIYPKFINMKLGALEFKLNIDEEQTIFAKFNEVFDSEDIIQFIREEHPLPEVLNKKLLTAFKKLLKGFE